MTKTARKAATVSPHRPAASRSKPQPAEEQGVNIFMLPSPEIARYGRPAEPLSGFHGAHSRLARRRLLKRYAERRRMVQEQAATPVEEQVRDAVARLVGAGAVSQAVEEALAKVVQHGAAKVKKLSGLLVVSEPGVPASQRTQDLVDKTAIRRFDPVAQRLQQRAVDAILGGTAWLTSKEVGIRADPNAANKHSLASRWLSQGRIFAIEHSGQKVFPDYEFDPLGNPIPEMQELLAILEGYSSFRLASWFESSSSQLGGKKPQELLARNPKAVIAAARAHITGPAHG
jgi:hypothetical protein